MFTKLFVFCSTFAVLSIARSLADTFEIIEIGPQNQQNNPCQQYADYYDKYYNNYYNNYYNDYYYNYYKQLSNQQPQIPNISINNAKVEWVCTNPKTKDTMIIGSEEVPSNGHYYPQQQQPNYQPKQPHYRPPHQPPKPSFPTYPNPQQNSNNQPQQPNYQPQQPNHRPPKPTFPFDPNSQQNPNNQPQQPAQTDKPNTNGEGIIDIRFGDE